MSDDGFPDLTAPDLRRYSGFKLKDWPSDVVMKFSCEACGRFGQYRPATLIAKYGADYPLAGFARVVAEDCAKRENLVYDQCGARMVGPTLSQLKQQGIR